MPEFDSGEITITFGDDVYRGNYLEDLKIEGKEMNELLSKQPSLYVFWSKMAAMSRVIYDKAKIDLEKYEAQLYTYIKSDRETRGEKTTEKQLENLVKLDPRRNELYNILLRARLQYDLLNSVREAFSIRSSMLMSLAANLREEFLTSMSMYNKDVSSGIENLRTDERAKLLMRKAQE